MLSYFKSCFRLEGDTTVTGDVVSGGETGLSFSCLEGSTNWGNVSFLSQPIMRNAAAGIEAEYERASASEYV